MRKLNGTKLSPSDEFDNRMTYQEVEEQESECELIYKQTQANLTALKDVENAMIDRLRFLGEVEIVKLTRREKLKRDNHNQELKALKALKASMINKGTKLGNV